MQSRTVELWVGLFVALGLAALAFLSVRASNLAEYRDGDAYTVVARFENIGSLRVRAPVTVAGVRIGRDFDTEQFKAVVTLAITARYNNLPQDTVAAIRTAGLIGEQFIGLDPGGAPDALKEGDEIEITQSALVIEQLIGQFLYGQAGKSNTDGGK